MRATTSHATMDEIARRGSRSRPSLVSVRGQRPARLPMAIAVLACGLALAAGCGSDDGDGERPAGTTAQATTEATTAATETTTTTAESEQKATRPGDPAIGLQVFTRSCEGCHADAGKQSGYGPRLAGQALNEPRIRRAVTTGPGLMPAGLVSGQELADVAAYVASLQ